LSGDIYSTQGSLATPIDITQILNTPNTYTFSVTPGLAYTSGQTTIVAIDASNFFTGTVESQDNRTGQLTILPTSVSGSGTTGTFFINLDGAPGRQGPTGPQGLQGPTGPQGPVASSVGEVPIGGIIMWSGQEGESGLPLNFRPCDGNTYERPDNTFITPPNLKNRFIIGAGDFTIGNTGGSADAIIVSHSHTAIVAPHKHTFTYAGCYDQDGTWGGTGYNIGRKDTQNITTDPNDPGATVGVTISEFGESGAGKNLPPYYTLLYIMRIY
jgi:hypothetical protein